MASSHCRKLKDKIKAMETPEQKRARRLDKKLKKEQKTKEQLGWDEECMVSYKTCCHLLSSLFTVWLLQGYSNVDNPFGDTKLTEVFVWRKKLEKEGLADAPIELIEKRTKQKLQNSKVRTDFFSKFS